jgi:hypothetical protein
MAVVAVLPVLIFTVVAGAQLPTGTIQGVVRDSSGGNVPEAKVLIENTDTNLSRTVATGDDGAYRVPALPVGHYQIRIEKPGFKTLTQSGLTLEVAQEIVANAVLEVGSSQQEVTVTAEAPLVNTTSGSLGGLVTEERIADLPLNGRNYVDLTLMQTGINEQKAISVGGSGTSGTYFSSNGAPVRSNNYLLDGANMTNIWGATSASISNSTLGVDGIKEYRIITNSVSAEYGMTMGSQMVIVSKGGSNRFSGDVFEYLRNSALDAKNPFDTPASTGGRRLPPFKRNNFGGSFGGPIKKDKSFFYGVFEGVRERLGLTILDNVMDAGCHGVAGAPGEVITYPACTQLTSSTPSAVISAVSAPLLALYPKPNVGSNQYSFPFTQPTSDNYGQIRFDQNFSTKDSFFARYTIQDTSQLKTGAFPQFGLTQSSRNQFLTLSENHIFSQTLLNSFRVSLSRVLMSQVDNPSEPSGPLYSLIPGQHFGGVSMASVTGIGSNGTSPFLRKQNLFTYSDDIFYTKGKHSLQFGLLINHYQQEIGSTASSKGSIAFANVAGFLTAKAQTISGLVPGSLLDRVWHYNTFGFYGQDDWRVLPRLTLNLGLRYEIMSVPQEQQGHWSSLRSLFTDKDVTVSPAMFLNPSLKNFGPRIGFAWDVQGNGKAAVRGGFGRLFDIGQTGAMSINSSFGNYPFTVRDSVSNPAAISIPLVFPPTADTRFPRVVDYHFRQPHMLQYNLTVERQLPLDMALTVAYAGSRGFNLLAVQEGNPTIPQGVPNSAGGCIPKPVDQAVNLTSFADGSATACWLGNDPRVNTNWPGSIDLWSTNVNSWYSGLQLGLIKRMRKGFQIQSAYTWSKTTDENQSGSLVEQGGVMDAHGTDPIHRTVDKGPAPFDVTNVWKVNSMYRLPGLTSSDGVASKFVNGWWVSGILTLQSGSPFTPALGFNRSMSGSAGAPAGMDRPDIVVGRTPSNIVFGGTSAGCTGLPAGTSFGPRNTAHYFDPCAFTIPNAGFLGTASRNMLRAPGYAGLDFSMAKDTPLKSLGENGNVQFRLEFFNIFNRANFGLPNRTVYTGKATGEPVLGTAGQITSTVGTSRQVQVALKLLF